MVGDCVILAAVILIDVIAVIDVFSYVHMQVCCVHDGDADVFASLLASVPWQYSAFSAPELALDGRSPHLARSNEEEVSAAAQKSSAHSARKVGQRACQVCNPDP